VFGQLLCFVESTIVTLAFCWVFYTEELVEKAYLVCVFCRCWDKELLSKAWLWIRRSIHDQNTKWKGAM